MQMQNDNTISIGLMTKEDRIDFDRLNRKYKEEISKYCPENASVWEMKEFIDSPFRAGYAIFIGGSEEELNPFSGAEDMYSQDEPPRYKDGQIVGFILCDYDNYTWNGSCYIQQFYVDDAFRRKGIGILAMKCLMEKEWKFTLHVMKNNEPAQRFWRAVKQELDLDDWHEENFLKIETEDAFCDFFYWENRKMQWILDGAFTYQAAVPFTAGDKIYGNISDLMARKHEVFDAWYDKFDRLVIIDDNELTGKRYYMILDGEDSIVVFRDRTQVYVITDPDFIAEEELFESLNMKVGNMKEYLDAFQKWQREKQFTARREFYRSPWEDEEEEDLFFERTEPRHRHHKFRRCPLKRKRRRKIF